MDQVSNVVLRLEAEVTQLKNCLLPEQLQGTGGGGSELLQVFCQISLKNLYAKTNGLAELKT
jgi:hypothetical protein